MVLVAHPSMKHEQNKNIMKVKDKKELEAEIEKAIQTHGNEVDLNYINTSDIVDMSCLFYIMRLFNGDVSQ